MGILAHFTVTNCCVRRGGLWAVGYGSMCKAISSRVVGVVIVIDSPVIGCVEAQKEECSGRR